MTKILNWLVNLVPAEYRIGIAIKKVSYTIGKLAAGFLTSRLVSQGTLTPEQCGQIQVGLTALVAGGLTFIQDWVKLKYPEAAKWL